MSSDLSFDNNLFYFLRTRNKNILTNTNFVLRFLEKRNKNKILFNNHLLSFFSFCLIFSYFIKKT